MVRVLAAHHRVLGSIPGPGVELIMVGSGPGAELIMVGSRPCSKGFLHVPQISSLLNKIRPGNSGQTGPRKHLN